MDQVRLDTLSCLSMLELARIPRPVSILEDGGGMRESVYIIQ